MGKQICEEVLPQNCGKNFCLSLFWNQETKEEYRLNSDVNNTNEFGSSTATTVRCSIAQA